ncbi:MAG: endonuclease domain-containing protein [Nitrospirae bacterium]|nr:endonuclease domain-containing protein [Nitrospirota bacterium]
MTRIYNRSTEKTKRKQLRGNMTLAEIILWSKLKGKGIGHKFRRQYSVGIFVLDFCCPILKLAIEVDGDSHFSENAKIRDREREEIIRNYGFTFMRFTNNEIIENLEGVIATVMQYIEGLTTPTPPCQGGDSIKQTGRLEIFCEKKTGKRVVSSENYLSEPESRKRLERKK